MAPQAVGITRSKFITPPLPFESMIPAAFPEVMIQLLQSSRDKLIKLKFSFSL